MAKGKELIFDYYYALYLKGLSVKREKLQELSDNGYDIKEIIKPVKHFEVKKSKKKFNIKPKRDFTVLSEKERGIEAKTNLEVTDEPFTETLTEKIIFENEVVDDKNLIRTNFGKITDAVLAFLTKLR